MKISKIAIAGAAALTLVGVSAAADAAVTSPVDGSGTIHGCYYAANKSGSHKVVLQEATTSCPRGSTAIAWNRTGPAGPAAAVPRAARRSTPRAPGPPCPRRAPYRRPAGPR